VQEPKHKSAGTAAAFIEYILRETKLTQEQLAEIRRSDLCNDRERREHVVS